MKKTAIIIMTLALLLSVSACNKEAGDTSDTTDTIAVQEDATAQSNADNNATEKTEQMTDGKGNDVVSTDKQSVEEQNGNAVESKNTTASNQDATDKSSKTDKANKTDKAEKTTTEKSGSSQKDEKTTVSSNPFGSGIELPEMEV